MRFYTGAWRTAVVVSTGLSLVAGVLTIAPTLAVMVAVLASTAATFGWCWGEDPVARRRFAARAALWAGCSGAILTGLPLVIGMWSLLVLVVLGLTAPVVVTGAWRAVTAGRPERRRPPVEHLSDRDLERRWRSTTRRVRSRGLPTAEVTRLVEERARLLDELERRDPDRFATWLLVSV